MARCPVEVLDHPAWSACFLHRLHHLLIIGLGRMVAIIGWTMQMGRMVALLVISVIEASVIEVDAEACHGRPWILTTTEGQSPHGDLQR